MTPQKGKEKMNKYKTFKDCKAAYEEMKGEPITPNEKTVLKYLWDNRANAAELSRILSVMQSRSKTA